MPGFAYPGGGYPAGDILTGTAGGTPPPAEHGPVSIAGAYRQQETLVPGRYSLRHIAPKQSNEGEPGIVNPFGAGFVVLGQTLYAAPLPISRLPDSPDFHEGSTILRMLDAGEFTLTFPNKDSSDGQPWRSRFSAIGHSQFVEIAREGEPELIGCIVKLAKDRQKITATGYDGIWLLKKGYEPDWVGVMAPRDVMERYSQLWVLAFARQFSEVNPLRETERLVAGEATSTLERGVLVMKATGSKEPGGVHEGSLSNIKTEQTFTQERDKRWQLQANFTVPSEPTAQAWDIILALGADGVSVTLENGEIAGTVSSAPQTALPNLKITGTHTLTVESDGRWIRGYLDGIFLGIGEASPEIGHSSSTSKITFAVETLWPATGSITAELSRIVYRECKPFLMRGSEKGDYVLPGTITTYPWGGLHGRYVNVGSFVDTGHMAQALAPDPRRTGYPDYIQTQESINYPTGEWTLPPGVPGEYFTARWFGAVYLDLQHNNEIPFTLGLSPESGCRVWVGDTKWGAQIIDTWNTLATEVTGNAKSSVLGQKAGWFPIVVEFFHREGPPGFVLDFKAPNAGWTDPGGAAIPTNTIIRIPSTSLSPLGCVDARIQGSSHYDIVLEQAKNFGYQVRAEYRTLESGLFPCQIIPRARVGQETDELVEPDDVDRKSGAPVYTNTEDSTDSANSVRAFGSGIADGKGSQIAFEAISVPDEAADLFDMQAWVSASDIAFPGLLAARANAELAVRLGTWQNVEGEPIARDRLADTFPLTGALNLFKWQPGDGVRLWLPDAGVFDHTPRQIMQVTRAINAEGRLNTSVGFRSRPKDPHYTLRQTLRDVSRSARSYQHQYVTRVSSIVEGTLAPAPEAGQFSNYGVVSLTPSERVIGAVVHLGVNTANMPLGLEINTVDVTLPLVGPWHAPGPINVMRYAKSRSSAGQDYRMFFRLINEGTAAATQVTAQLVLTILV